MAFTGQDVVDLAEIYLRGNIITAEAIKVINLAVNTFGGMGFVYEEDTITALAMTFIALPNDSIGVIFVVDENDNLYYRWQVEGGQIRFADAGDYKVSYRKIPDEIATLAGEVDLLDIYKSAVIAFVIGFAKLKDDDHSPDGARQEQKAERLAVLAFNTMIKSRKPTQVRTFRHA